jgi:hypothetical protein
MYEFICFFYRMTTITLDTPLHLKKTHFRDPTELMYYFAGLQLQLQKKQLKKKSQYDIAMEDLAA